MKLTPKEIGFISGYFRNEFENVPYGILEKIELGLWIPLSMIPVPRLEIIQKSDQVGLLSASFEPEISRLILDAFRRNQIPYLLVRIEASWQCYIQCNGQIFEATCAEDKDSTVTCCSDLRSKCDAMRDDGVW